MLYDKSDLERELKELENVGRSEFRRDFGRLLHSPSFRRLQGKTQLFPGHESDFFRNRLTHSLEVAQIAKGIAQQINTFDPTFKDQQIDEDLVEFAGLAHDLGHPPFGHNGEKALDDCMKSAGGFEGNAQTLRILSKVEKKVLRDTSDNLEGFCGVDHLGNDLRLGLNLTYRALASVLKYDKVIPVRRLKEDKLVKGYYISEKALVGRVKANVKHVGFRGKFKTLECRIMDLADDIAYSTYDLEDALKGGFTHPLELLAKVANDQSLREKLTAKVRDDVAGVTEIDVIKTLLDLFPPRNSTKASWHGVPEYVDSKLVADSAYFRTRLTSEFIGKFISDVRVIAKPGKSIRFSELDVPRETLLGIAVLKHLNYLLMIMSPRLKVVEYRGYDVVKAIFKALDSKDGYLLMPSDCQELHRRLKSRAEKKRLVCDFVAGMTDRYAIQFFNTLHGAGSSIFTPM